MTARLALLALLLTGTAPVEEFSFIHCSDTHSPVAGSEETIAEMRGVGEVELEPYKVKAKAPSFVVVTGDLTEYGGPSAGRAWWDKYLGYWKDFKVPVWHVAGNHDNTWDSIRPALRKAHGGACYSFEKHGCRFIVLDSASVQDPRPSFGAEVLGWLREDLRKVKKDTPLFIFFHHPPERTEFASAYDYQRLFDLVRPYHVAAFCVGHYHTAWGRPIEGFDVVCGGSTFGKDRGYSIVSVSGGTLRVAYRKLGEEKAALALLEKKLEPAPPHPVRVRQPVEDDEVSGDSVSVIAEVASKPKSVIVDLDEGKDVEMTQRRDGAWGATVSVKDVPPGRHLVRVSIGTHSRIVPVRVVRDGGAEERWRVQLGGAVRAMRAHGERLYAGAGDGVMHCLRLADGAPVWTFATGGEILSRPAVVRDAVVFGSGDGNVYALDAATGKEKWRHAAEAASYASPAAAEGVVVVATNAGAIRALDVETGAVRWSNTSAEYAVESALHVADGVVYAGAWDQHAYAVSLADGALKWKCQGAGSAAEKAKKYYSPADCGPVASGGRVWVADRKYMLTVIEGGKAVESQEDVSAVGLSEDGKAVYLRRTKDRLVKMEGGAEAWSASVDTDAIPGAPVEHKGVVVVCSGRGLVSAVEAASGKVLWQYQATPRLYVLGPPEVKERLVFVGCQDGTVTALQGP